MYRQTQLIKFICIQPPSFQTNRKFCIHCSCVYTGWILCITLIYTSAIGWNKSYLYKKGKGLPQHAEVAQGVPGRLRPRIFLTFGITRVVGHHP